MSKPTTISDNWSRLIFTPVASVKPGKEMSFPAQWITAKKWNSFFLQTSGNCWKLTVKLQNLAPKQFVSNRSLTNRFCDNSQLSAISSTLMSDAVQVLF